MDTVEPGSPTAPAAPGEEPVKLGEFRIHLVGQLRADLTGGTVAYTLVHPGVHRDIALLADLESEALELVSCPAAWTEVQRAEVIAKTRQLLTRLRARQAQR